MKPTILLVFVLLATLACETGGSDTDKAQTKKTEQMVSEANKRMGVPNITKFTEKRFLKMIYELRDKEVKTYSYFMDMTGRLHFLCESIGYGISAAYQYVSPQKLVQADLGARYGEIAMPQPEPNALFSPAQTDATYVLCADKKGKIKPVYSEPKLIVSPFKLKHVGDLRE